MKNLHWLSLALVLCVTPARAIPPQSNHGVLKTVPVPKIVKVDGKLSPDEWDKSGGMFVYPVGSLRKRYSVRVHAMWDTEAVYFGLEYRDPTPLINNVDAVASPHLGWQSDGFQGRFVLNGQMHHLTTWYSSLSKKCAVHVHRGNAGYFGKEVQQAFLGDKLKLQHSSGVRMAFRKNADNRGYTQELRVPWKVMDAKFQPKPGQKVSFVGEYFWGGPSGVRWPQVMWSDPVNQKTKVRIVLYQSAHNWGKMEFLAKGNLPRVSVEEDEEIELLQGPIPVRVKLPGDASYFTLVIDDENGKRVRNLVSHARVNDFLVQNEKGQQIVEVAWDGRADGPWHPERKLFLGDYVKNGKYTVRGLTHSGVGVTHAGSFYNPGDPPWPTADGKGGWLSDHAPPTALAAVPKSAKSKVKVFIGSQLFECGCSFIGLDDDGRKIWRWTRGGAPQIAANDSHVFIGMP